MKPSPVLSFASSAVSARNELFKRFSHVERIIDLAMYKWAEDKDRDRVPWLKREVVKVLRVGKSALRTIEAGARTRR